MQRRGRSGASYEDSPISPTPTTPIPEYAAACGFGHDDRMQPADMTAEGGRADLYDLVAGIAEGDAALFASDLLGAGGASSSQRLTRAALQEQQAQLTDCGAPGELSQ